MKKQCEKCFATKSTMKIHEKSHETKRLLPETCDICKKHFRSKYDLRDHVRIHANERPFECKSCGKGFTKKTYLTSHERIHLGIKSFKCSTCEKSFSKFGYL